MKKEIIATIVGAIILFVWQFLSWSILPVHQSEYGYSANQDQIMTCLTQNLSESGTYMLPGSPPGTSHEEAEKDMEKHLNKPWATIHYHSSFEMSMGMNMLRGFAVDLLAIFLLTWLLRKSSSINIKTAVTSSVAIGLIGYLTIPYLNSIWFPTNSLGHLVDAIASWGIVGVWLGWYLGKE
ncbi:MAG: hypothetical protein ABIO44_04110 [Saprospiraceae bacterium]